MSGPFVVATTCVRRRPWAASLWVAAMAAQARRPDAVLVVVDDPQQGEGTFSAWDAALREAGGCGYQTGIAELPVPNWEGRNPWFLMTYPHPSAPGWHRGTRESGWKEVPEGVAGRYSDDQHAHLARLRNWTVERALELWPQCTHVWCTDSDVQPEPDVLGLLLAADKPVVGAVVRNGERAWNFMLGGRIYVDGRWEPQPSISRDSSRPWEPWRKGGIEGDLLSDGKLFSVSMTGACALYSREALDRGLRWGPHPRGEDVALAIQARELNIGLWVEPRARCAHFMNGPDQEPLR